MGYLEGFGVTIKKWLGPGTDTGRRVTSQYPEQTRPKPERFHGRHVLNRYDDGMEKCIGCELCAGVCPARCIYVRGADNDPDDPTSPGERYGFIYEINYLRCIHCDLCVEACPTEAITETKLFEFAFTNRADAIYTKAELVVDDDGRPRQQPWENWDGGFDPAQDTSGWMRATAPGGDADFVGIVAWAGELGYGVRAPEGGGTVEPRVAEDLARAEAPVSATVAHDEAEAAVAPAPAPTAATFDAPASASSFDAPIAATPPAAAPEVPAAPEPVADAGADDPAPDDTDTDVPADLLAGRTLRPLLVDADEPDAAPATEDDADDEPPAAVDEPPVAPTADDPAPDEPPADEPPADPAASAPGSDSGAGYFDLPYSTDDEPEPKRRRRGWGRR